MSEQIGDIKKQIEGKIEELKNYCSSTPDKILLLKAKVSSEVDPMELKISISKLEEHLTSILKKQVSIIPVLGDHGFDIEVLASSSILERLDYIESKLQSLEEKLEEKNLNG